MTDNVPESKRDFETRLNYIHDIFSELYTPEDIMANCILFKLDRSYAEYLKTVNHSMWDLSHAKPLKVFKVLEEEM